MNTNWRTTIGGALSSAGKAMIGVGVVPQLGGVPSKTLTYIAVAGYGLDIIGGFLSKLFAADAKTVDNLSVVVAQNSAAIAATPAAIKTGDTSFITKAQTQTEIKAVS